MKQQSRFLIFAVLGEAVVAGLLMPLWLCPAVCAASVVTAVEFNGATDPAEIQVRATGPFTVETHENVKDQQIVVDLKGATFSGEALKSIDTTSFGGKLTQIIPAQTSGQSDASQLILQFREAGNADVIQSGNNLLVRVPQGSSGSKAGGASSSPGGDKLNDFFNTQSTKKFSGKPISLNVRDVDVNDIFRLIGEASGFNVMVGGEVQGKMTLSLTDVPWDQALDLILHTLQLGAERTHNILRITTLKNLTSEKQQELQASQILKATTPKVTRVFAISYANLGELVSAVTRFSAVGGSGGGVDPVIVQADARTNSIIYRDTPENIERVKKLIDILDTQTPQVMIEAKVVEVTESFSKSLSGSLGSGNYSGNSALFGSMNGGNPLSQLVGAPGVYGTDGTAIASGSAGSGLVGFAPDLSFLGSNLKLNALLSMGENESEVKVLASPKSVVLNRQRASILSSTPVQGPPSTTNVSGAGSTATTPVFQSNISLSVTPTVTNDGGVLMDLSVSKDLPVQLAAGFGIGARNMTTQVLVDSGVTLIIGGIYTELKTTRAAGFPILRNLPLVGALFGSESSASEKEELLIFVTPRIINSKDIFKGG
jgi:type IV pilus assembly protein PilQ